MHSSAHSESASDGARPRARRSLARRLIARVLDLTPAKIGVAARGFDVRDPAKAERLERITSTVAHGYRSALRTSEPRELAQELAGGCERELVGFAFEGAALALEVLDVLLPWSGPRWSAFAAGAGDAHVYMLHVGAGLALGRLRRRVGHARAPFQPLLSALVADGAGFHAGYFGDARRALVGGRSARVAPELHGAHDQGLGRSLWFVGGADVHAVAGLVALAARERHAELWSGVGLAAAYAGAVTRAELLELRALCAGHRACVAQGAAFAAEARERAGNAAEHTELACAVLAGCSAAAAARAAREARARLEREDAPDAYARWQSLAREHFAEVHA